MPQAYNDDEPGIPDAPPPDAHGEAALLLVESLIHGLVARAAMSPREAVAMIDVAHDAAVEIVDARGAGMAGPASSTLLLARMAASLAIDVASGADPA